MRPTKTLVDLKKVRAAIHRGVLAVYEPVRMTMGPEGKNALIPRTHNRGVRISNDGHAVAQVQEPKDDFALAVVKVMQDAESKTNARAGDGTTGTTVIAGKLYLDMEKRLSEGSGVVKSASFGGGVGVMSLRREILSETKKVKEAILKVAKKTDKLEDLEKIATISVEDPELGKVIAKLSWEVGPDGFVDVVEGYKGEIETDLIKGMRFPAKVPARAFVNRPEKYEMLVQDTPVIVTNHNIDNPAQLSFTRNLKTAKLAIIAPSFSESVLVELIKAGKNGFMVFPVATPALRTEQFEDLAIYLGAEFANKDKGKRTESIVETDLGFVEKLIVKETDAKEDAVATGGGGTKTIMVAKYEDKAGKKGKERTGVKETTAVAERIEILKGQLAEQKSETFKKMMERRIASMASGVGVIRVGAPSDTELYYKKLKIEDAVYACRAALRNGYVKGGGLCLKDIADELPEGHVLKEALLAPYNQIRENAERDMEVGEDVIDPADAIYWAVENATSVVAHLITLGSITIEGREKEPNEGFEAIATAMMQYNRFWAKKEGIWKQNEAEMEGDQERLRMELEAADND